MCDIPDCKAEATTDVVVVMVGDQYSPMNFELCPEHTREVAASANETQHVTVLVRMPEKHHG